MDNLMIFWTSALTALAVENAVFARALGLNKTTLFLKSPHMGILYGGILTWIVTISALPVAAVNAILEGSPYIPFVRAPLYFVCVAAVYLLTRFGSKRLLPGRHRAIRAALPVSTFNSALFGALHVSAYQNFGFLQTTGYALGAGIGYTAALLVVYYARKRLAISPVPRPFRGLPVLLLYIGLLSLAIYGLIGHMLPV